MSDPVAVPGVPQECSCSPAPHIEGPCAWCDIHGQPSAAYRQGYEDGQRGARLGAAASASDPDRPKCNQSYVHWPELRCEQHAGEHEILHRALTSTGNVVQWTDGAQWTNRPVKPIRLCTRLLPHEPHASEDHQGAFGCPGVPDLAATPPTPKVPSTDRPCMCERCEEVDD